MTTMQKILLIFNGASSANLLSFGCYLAGLTSSRLTGIFPGTIEYDEMPEQIRKKTVSGADSFIDEEILVDDSRSGEVATDIRRFQDVCERKAIHATVSTSSRMSVADITAESRFSDLIIIDATPQKGYRTEAVHERIIKELLSSVECPVIVAPASFEEIEEVVFWNNGSVSAAFAMKQFAYMLPLSEYVRATIASTQKEEGNNTEDKHMLEWLNRHYEYGDVITLREHQEKNLFDYLLRKKKVMVVTGAHGRAALLRFFEHSWSDLQLKTLPFPLFITHH
jgi:hypothetical protein